VNECKPLSHGTRPSVHGYEVPVPMATKIGAFQQPPGPRPLEPPAHSFKNKKPVAGMARQILPAPVKSLTRAHLDARFLNPAASFISSNICLPRHLTHAES